jgi:hypothetical protein
MKADQAEPANKRNCIARVVRHGDYVLATKWSDGDPLDQWAVGFYDKPIMEGRRHLVTDTDGNQMRHNGFRRVAKISKKRGEFILSNAAIIESASRSLWWWKRRSMSA